MSSTGNPMDPNADLDPELVRRGRALAQSWTWAEFDAALPLYAGGDLDPLEAAAVRAYAEQEPRAVAAVEAALAARGVLAAGVVPAAELDGVDLWPGVRAALVAEGLLGAPTAVQRPAPARPRPVLVGAGRSGVAAAAAVLFTAGLAWVLGLGSTPRLEPDRPDLVVETSPRVARAGGAPIEVLTVGAPELPEGVIRLGELVGRPLLDAQAQDVDLSNYHPDAAFPIAWPSGSSNAVVGGTVGAREAYLVAPRGR